LFLCLIYISILVYINFEKEFKVKKFYMALARICFTKRKTKYL